MNTRRPPRPENERLSNRDGFIASLAFWGLLAFALFGFAGLVLKFWPYTMDDSYITFRYARNFAAGHGLVFNPGESPRAEGITSPLYAILLSLAPASIDLPTVSKCLGVLSICLTALLIGVLIFRACRCVTSLQRPILFVMSAAGASYYLLNPYIVGNAMSGMETSLAGLTFALFLFLLSISVSNEKPRFRWLVITGMSATLVPMFRPEMGLSVIVGILTLWLFAPAVRRHTFIILCTFFALGTLYFVSRYVYYQMLLPLPFYIKQGGFSLYGISEVKDYLRHSRVVVLSTFACLAFASAQDARNNRLVNTFLIACILAIACQLAYYSTIRHIMGFGLRYFQPLAAGIVFVGFVGACRIYGSLNASRCRNLISLPIVFGGVFGLLLLGNVGAYWSAKHVLVDWYARGYGEKGITNWQPIVDAASGKSLIIAMNDCGKFPYYTGFPTVDLAGLNNRVIARGHSSLATLHEIERKDPSLVILCGVDKHDPGALRGWERVSSSEIRSLGYHYVGAIKVGKMLDRSDYYWLVFTKEDQDTHRFINELAAIGIFEYVQISGNE